MVRSLEIKDGQDWFTRSQRELFDEIIQALSPSSPGEPAARNVTEEDARMFDAALSNSVDVVHSGDPLPAPPRERSEGEQTERPDAGDPYVEQARAIALAMRRANASGMPGQLVADIASAMTAARNAGREEMRERAELIALRWRDSAGNDHGIYIGNGIATAIRSLPLQAEGEDTPHG